MPPKRKPSKPSRKRTVEEKPTNETGLVDHIEPTKLPEVPASKAKFELQTWISITNLILTAIIGIGVAIYLQYSQQNFEAELQAKEQEYQNELQIKDDESQKQIIELQRQLGVSNIRVDHYMPAGILGGHLINITNKGPATAKNIRIAICIDYLSPVWKSSINDISQFPLKEYTNPSLEIHQEFITTSCNVQFENNGNNAIIVTIDTIPPNERFGVVINLPPEIQTQKTETHLLAHVLTPKDIASKPSNDTVLIDPIFFFDSLIDYLAIARFHTETSCENCIMNTDEESVVLVKEIRTDTGGVSTNQKITSESDTDYISDLEMNITYDVPVESNPPSNLELYFSEEKNEFGFYYYRVSE